MGFAYCISGVIENIVQKSLPVLDLKFKLDVNISTGLDHVIIIGATDLVTVESLQIRLQNYLLGEEWK